jgi:hypothetical protein
LCKKPKKLPSGRIFGSLQVLRKTEAFPKSVKLAISHADDFAPQLYTVWNFPKSTNAVKHFGNVPPEIGPSSDFLQKCSNLESLPKPNRLAIHRRRRASGAVLANFATA